ncbi:MAG: hypothetical protein JETCAE01_27370 [Anaerolineaceae bacterium]|nr:MAG: hypothetical protein JETCAE01_27370 [Anaerolineaceae bacterium]
MDELASFDAAISQSEGFEKLSVMMSVPRPGRISGVGALVDKFWGVGVSDGGNQMRVEVGCGVSVKGMGVETASQLSMNEHDERRNAVKPDKKSRLKVIGFL